MASREPLDYPVFQAFDANGAPLSSGTVEFFDAGTTDQRDTYSDPDLTTTNPNPVTLNSRGEPESGGGTAINIYLDNQPYKMVLKDSSGSTIRTVDNYIASSPITVPQDPADASVQTTDDYEGVLSRDPEANEVFTVDFQSANTTTTPTFENTNGSLGALSIKTKGGTDLWESALDGPHELQYDGTNYVVLDPQLGEYKINDNNETQIQHIWPNVNSVFKQAGLDAASVGYAFERDAAIGSVDSFLVTFRQTQGAPGANTTQYAFKAAAVTESSQDGSNRVEVIPLQGEAVIAAGNTDGAAQGAASVARHLDGTADGRLIGHEVVVENKNTDPGAASPSATKLKKGLAINSDGTAAIFSGLDLRGSLASGIHHGVYIAAGKLADSVFWHDGESKLTNDSLLGLGVDTPVADIHIQKTGVREIRQVNDANPGAAGAIGKWSAIARDDTAGDQHEFVRLQMDVFNAADGSEKGQYDLQRMQNGTLASALKIQAGIFTPSATGGDPGVDKVNAVEVQDDGSTLTDYVFDAWHRDMDERYPYYSDVVKAAADKFDDKWMEPASFAAFWKLERRLPGMPDLNDCIDGHVKMGLGAQIHKLTQVVELQAIHIDKLNQRIRSLENG